MPPAIKGKPPVKPAQVEEEKVVIVGHVTESYGPMQALPKYLLKKFNRFAVIDHPFSYCGIPDSRCVLFERGKEKAKYSWKRNKFKIFYFIHYFGDIIITLYFFLRLREKWDVFIGCDCLNSFTGLLLKVLGVVKKVIFYENEYKVRRFREKLLDKIFHLLNTFVAKNADVIWDSPPNLQEVREKQGVNPAKIVSVPHGVDLEKIRILDQDKIDRKTLVYVGHVIETKGLQLVVYALKEIVKSVPDIKMAIVGSGPYEPEFKKLVEKNNLLDHFIFWGYTDHDWTLSYLPSCGIGLAPYAPLDKQALMNAEPLKVKDYLACGLPVIITRFADGATNVGGKKMGITINYRKKEMKKAMLKLLTDKKFYQNCRKNILTYGKNISWNETFNRAFRKTFNLFYKEND